MSLGDDSSKSPINSLVSNMTSRFDAVFGQAFKEGVGGDPPARSLMTSPSSDVQGRRTLLGAS